MLGLLAARAGNGAMTDGMLSPLAAFLIGEPAAVAMLLAEHVDGGPGRFRVCLVGAHHGHVSWPCGLHAAAAAAHHALSRPVRRR